MWCSAVARQDLTAALYYDAGSGADWQDVPVSARQVVAMTRGAAADGQDSPPGTAAATLDDQTREYSPLNVTSSLYGRTGRNTPLQLAVGGTVRSTTEVSDWDPEESADGRVAWTGMSAAGVLRRLGQGKTPLRTPNSRAVTAAGPAAHWPLDDGRDSDQAASGLAGGTAMTETGGVGFGAVPGPGGGGALVAEVVKDSAYTGGLSAPVAVTSSTGWTVDVWFRATAAADDSNAVLAAWTVSGTYGAVDWTMYVAKIAGVHGVVVVADHDPLSSTSFNETGDGIVDGDWHMVRMSVTQDDPDTITAQLYFDGAASDSFTDSPYTAGVPRWVYLGDDARPFSSFTLTATESAAVAEVVVWPTPDPSLSAADAYSAGRGWIGEAAGRRFLRLGVELGITTTVVGDPDDTQPMGIQPRDTPLRALADCVKTDVGLMFEPADSLGVVMRTGRDLANQTVALALDYTQIKAGTLKPQLGSKGAYNDVTAKRATGGQARAVLETGRMSVLDAPDGMGRVERQVDVNPASDATLLALAQAYLHRGIADEPRWPAVVVELTSAAPALIAAVEAVDIGDLVTISGLPAHWTPDLARLIVVGIQESVPTHARRVGLVCIPAQPFEVGLVGEDDGSSDLRGQAVDTDRSTLASGINETATSLSVASTGTVWSTNADGWSTSLNGTDPDGRTGLHLRIGGELMRVTNITGGTSPQTFTVVRSVNGVVKSHLAGAEVHAAYPFAVGL